MSGGSIAAITSDGSTNKATAASISNLDKRINRIVTPGVSIPTWDGQKYVAYPAQYQATDTPPMTEKARILKEITNSQYPGHEAISGTAGVSIPITESDVAAWHAKEDMELQKKFDLWIASRYNVAADPAGAQWLQKVYPQWFDARVEESKVHHQLSEQWHEIQIKGPQSLEDLYLMFRAETDPTLQARLDSKFVDTSDITRTPEQQRIAAAAKFQETKGYGSADYGRFNWTLPAKEVKAGFLTKYNPDVQHTFSGNLPTSSTFRHINAGVAGDLRRAFRQKMMPSRADAASLPTVNSDWGMN